MRVEKTKQVNNTSINQGINDLQNDNSVNPVQLSHSETKYEPLQYHSASSKAVPQITLQRITDSKIEQLSKKQQFLFENDINEKLQGIVHSSRIDQNSQRKGLFQNQNQNLQKLQHLFSAQMTHESILDSSEQQPQPRQANHQIMHSHHQSLSETRSLKSFRSLQDQRLQRQLKRRNDKSNQGSNSNGDYRAGNGNNGNSGGGGGSQKRQLSNIRELFNSKEEVKLFESKFKGSLEKLDEFEKEWQDFKVTHVSATTGGESSTKNQNQSQSASKIINEKEFTLRIDQISKLNQSFDTGISSFAVNSNPNVEQPSSSKNLLYNSQQYIDNKDNGSRTRSIERTTPLNNYQTQILSRRDTSRDRDRRPKPINADFKNQLDQINESPRESILQSPTSNYHNEKVKTNQSSLGLNVTQKLSKTQKQQQQQHQQKQQQQQQQQDSNSNSSNNLKQQINKECKTLKIDLNEDKAAVEARNQIRKAALKQQYQQQLHQQNDDSHNNSINANNNNSDLKNTSLNNNNTAKSQQSQNQIQQAKKMALKQTSSQLSNNNESSNSKSSLLLSNQNKLSQRDTPVIQSLSAQQMPKKDDLVERVIESIKVLNKKEEEIKQHHQQIQSKSNQHQISLNSKNKISNQYENNQSQQSQSLLQQLQSRKRTNTLTTGERPNMFGSSNLVQNQANAININNVLNKNNLLSHQHSQQQSQKKEINNQPMSQQIAQLKKQVQQQQQQEQQQQKQGPQTQANSSQSLNGFIGNSFIKQAQEKDSRQLSKKQSIQQDLPQSDQQQKDYLNTSITINTQQEDKLKLKAQCNLSHSAQSQSSSEQISQKPQTSIISKGTVVSQSTKDKVEQLRKAFASNKDSSLLTNQHHSNIQQQQQQSRSTKNLMSQSQNANNFSTQAQNFVNEKQHNFKNSSNNSNSNNYQGSSSQTMVNNIKANLFIKSEKTTKRADISLVNDNATAPNNAVNLSLNLSNQGGVGGGSNSSLNVTATTPSKQTIANIKKQNQITPKSKLNIATSPSHQQSISNNSSLISFSHSIQAKRNSQQQQNQQQSSTPIVSGSGLQTTTTAATKSNITKTKNSRRQPTQTQTLILNQIDSASSQNQISNNNSNNDSSIKIDKRKSPNKQENNANNSVVVEINTEVERVEGQKLVQQQQQQKKKNTMLDEYFHASPNDNKNSHSQRSSANNSKQISISRMKNKVDVQEEIEKDILESEREFLEQRQNKLNFQPIQEPSINWNPSPERQQMPERKLFAQKEQQQQKQENQNQKQFLDDFKQSQNQRQQQFQNYSQQNNEQQDQAEENDNQNRIEQRLNHLLEQTRRKMINYENDEESMLSDDQIMSMNQDMDIAAQNHGVGLGQLQKSMNQMNRMRNKAMTPQINSIPQFQSINQPHPQVSIPIPQQQPQPYIFDQSGQYPIIYGPQNIQYQQYQSPIIYPQQQNNAQAQPMITIINPAPIPFPNYQLPPQYTAFNQSPILPQYSQHPQVSLHQQNQAPHVMHHQPTSEVQTQHQQQFISQQQKQNFSKEQHPTISNNEIMIGAGNNSSRPIQNPNSSLIIGMDSQFFYPHSNSAENSFFLEDDPQLINNPIPKQLSQIQMNSQTSAIQTQAYITPPPLQSQHQQQQYYVIGYPGNYPQQIFQHPSNQNRPYVDSFRSQNNNSSSNNNNINSNNIFALSGGYSSLNQDKYYPQQQQLQPSLSQRGSPLINPRQQIQQFQQDIINNQSVDNEDQFLQQQNQDQLQQQQQLMPQ